MGVSHFCDAMFEVVILKIVNKFLKFENSKVSELYQLLIRTYTVCKKLK